MKEVTKTMMDLVSQVSQSQQAALSVEIGAAVASKAMDVMEIQGEMLLKLLDSAASMGVGGRMNLLG